MNARSSSPYRMRPLWRVSLGVLMTACAAVSVRAVDLGALTVQPQEVQARLQARQDCLAWYGFGEVPKELAFRPAPEGDELKATDGSFTGQRATRIYHGELRGKVLEVPPTGFTLCCWLKVHGIEAVDRDGYQRT